RGQAGGVDVLQGDLVDLQPGGAGGHGLVHQRHAEAAAAQDRQLHGSRTSRSSPSGRASASGAGERSVTRPVKRPSEETSRKPEPGSFSWSASRNAEVETSS